MNTDNVNGQRGQAWKLTKWKKWLERQTDKHAGWWTERVRQTQRLIATDKERQI